MTAEMTVPVLKGTHLTKNMRGNFANHRGPQSRFFNGVGWGWAIEKFRLGLAEVKSVPLRTGTMISAFAGMTFLFLASPACAEFFVGEGATGATFLKIPTSARAVGVAGAFSSLSGDISAIEYNPAGLCNIDRTDIMATYLDYIQDTSLQAVSVGFPISVGSAQRVESQNDPTRFQTGKLTLGLHYKVFRADDTERSALGVKGAEFNIRDQMAGLSLAYPLTSRMALGVSGKFIGQTLQNESSSNYAFDAGVQHKWANGWTAGASVQNIGPSKAFIQEKDPLPTLARLGVNRRWKRITLLAEGTEGRDKIVTGAAGAEWEINRYVRLRGGARHDTTLEFAGGLGVRFQGPQKAPVISAPRKRVDIENGERKNLESINSKQETSSVPFFQNIDIGIDYGLATQKDLGLTHTVSLRILY